MAEPELNEATFSEPFFVAPGSDHDGAAQFFLAAAEWCFNQEEININAPVKGEISHWIRGLYRTWIGGPRKMPLRGPENVQSEMLKESVAILADPRQEEETRLASLIDSIPPEDLRRLAETLKKGDIPALNAARAKIAERIMPRILREMSPERIPPLLTLVARMRAARAAGLCYILHKEHPLVLIKGARDGARRAVLDLVKIDKLFLHDRCTAKVIREAELQNDQRFLRQLGKAIAYKPKIGWRRAWRLQLFLFFALGVKLPALPILQLRVDPDGKRFSTFASFKKFAERCRADFNRIQPTA
jgi:hypothetical protein